MKAEQIENSIFKFCRSIHGKYVVRVIFGKKSIACCQYSLYGFWMANQKCLWRSSFSGDDHPDEWHQIISIFFAIVVGKWTERLHLCACSHEKPAPQCINSRNSLLVSMRRLVNALCGRLFQHHPMRFDVNAELNSSKKKPLNKRCLQ